MERDGSVKNHFSNLGQSVFISFVQKKLDQIIEGSILGGCVFGHGWCSVWFNPSFLKI